MSWGMVAGAAISVVGGYMNNKSAKKAASGAADAQGESAQLGIDESRRQFDAVQKLLSPYVQGGLMGQNGQQNLIGLNGAPAQQQAIGAIESSPMFGAMAKQGEDAILQNASATGGLRGGNAQAALGQFRPALLNSLIDQQYARLGGMTQIGQASAAGVGAAGMQTGQNVTQLLGQQGAAQAGALLAGGRADGQMINGIAGAAGNFVGGGGMSMFGSAPPSAGATGSWTPQNSLF